MVGWSFQSPFAKFSRKSSKSTSSSNNTSPTAMSAVKLYANWVSQPCRALGWALKVKGEDFEWVQTDFNGPIITSEEFKKWNPNGLVPVVRDGDFSLFESNAIFTYLADKYQWTDLYPMDAHARAKVNEFLHWHHTGTRKFTLEIVRPVIGQKLGAATPKDLEYIANIDKLIEQQFSLLEKFLDHDYIAHTDAPTIADYAAYCEIDQLEMMGYDFSKYEKVSAWIARMKAIPFHDEVHEGLDAFLKAIGLRATAQP